MPTDEIMPWCEGGGMDGIEGCHCSHEDPHLDVNTVERANWFAAERLREAARKGVRPLDELTKRRRARP